MISLRCSKSHFRLNPRTRSIDVDLCDEEEEGEEAETEGPLQRLERVIRLGILSLFRDHLKKTR